MVRKLLSNWLAKRKARSWLDDPVFRAGYLAGRKILNEGGFLAGLDEEVKKELAGQLTDHLLKVRDSRDSVVANREGFGSAVIEMAKAMVLLPKEHLPSHTAHLIEASQISGALYEHLDKAIEKDDKWSHHRKATPGEIDNDSILRYLYGRWKFFYQVHNVMRLQMADGSTDPEEDWGRQFLDSQLIWSEYDWREKLGLSQLLDPLEAVRHSMFLQFVISNARDPYRDWSEEWPSHEEEDDED